MIWRTLVTIVLLATAVSAAEPAKDEQSPAPVPQTARLVLNEDWSQDTVDPKRWYLLRKKWGHGNHGVVPENVCITVDEVGGKSKNVLACEAHGDQYHGAVVGQGGNASRVGGVIVSQDFFASGRFEIVMKIGSAVSANGRPTDPTKPAGAVPAIWTYGYRYVEVGRDQQQEFVSRTPLYNPLMERYGNGSNEYWSELDFPEFGKQGKFQRAMFNTYCQALTESLEFDVRSVMDGAYHSYTTEWRTKLLPLANVHDDQVAEYGGFWWIKDKSLPFDRYFGNPLKRLAKDEYSLYCGDTATHWIDLRRVGANTKFVPAMAAQLNLGIWLPDWAGPAAWQTSSVSFASIKVWQFDDAGDVRGILSENLRDNFDDQGADIK